MILTELNDLLADWGGNVIKEIQSRLESTGTNASGRTSASLGYELTDSGIAIYGRPFFRGVEEGRPAGRIPANMTQIIRQWMDDKNIASQFGTTESQKRSAAYLIGQYIKDHGTRLYREGGRDDIYSDVINAELPKLFAQIEGRVTQTIVDELK